MVLLHLCNHARHTQHLVIVMKLSQNPHSFLGQVKARMLYRPTHLNRTHMISSCPGPACGEFQFIKLLLAC